MRNGIVAGYDGSPGSDQALRWAVEETRKRGCTLTVCLAWVPHYLAVPDDPAGYAVAQNRGEHILAAGVSYARSALGAEAVVPLLARGTPAQVLCDQSASLRWSCLAPAVRAASSGWRWDPFPGRSPGTLRGPW